MFSEIKRYGHKILKDTTEKLTSVTNVSAFEEKRVLTPNEFLLAGDYLVRAFPTWKWASGVPGKRKPYLPADKQYLITRDVPCRQRESEMVGTAVLKDLMGDKDSDGLEDWAITDVTSGTSEQPSQSAANTEDNDSEPDEAAAHGSSATTNYRSYNLHITWDKYYRVPRFWLVGFSSSRALSAEEVYEDVSADHAGNTITWEEHPNEKMMGASIHPCKHASTMKKLGDMRVAAGKEFQVDHYFLVFLKFIQSIIPTIEYDYTMAS